MDDIGIGLGMLSICSGDLVLKEFLGVWMNRKGESVTHRSWLFYTPQPGAHYSGFCTHFPD